MLGSSTASSATKARTGRSSTRCGKRRCCPYQTGRPTTASDLTLRRATRPAAILPAEAIPMLAGLPRPVVQGLTAGQSGGRLSTTHRGLGAPQWHPSIVKTYGYIQWSLIVLGNRCDISSAVKQCPDDCQLFVESHCQMQRSLAVIGRRLDVGAIIQ